MIQEFFAIFDLHWTSRIYRLSLKKEGYNYQGERSGKYRRLIFLLDTFFAIRDFARRPQNTDRSLYRRAKSSTALCSLIFRFSWRIAAHKTGFNASTEATLTGI